MPKKPANNDKNESKSPPKTRRIGRKRLQDKMTPIAPHAPEIPVSGVTEAQLWRALDLVTELNQNMQADVILTKILDAAIELVGAERGFIILKHESRQALLKKVKVKSQQKFNGIYAVHLARNFDKQAIRDTKKAFSETIIDMTLRQGKTQALGAVSAHPLFATKKSVKSQNVQAVVCCPLSIDGEVSGAIYLDNQTLARSFSADEVRLVNVFSAQAGLAITNAKQLRELQEKSTALEKLGKELSAHNERKEEIIAEQLSHIEILDRELVVARDKMSIFQRFDKIKGRSEALRVSLSMLDRLCDNDETVLIQGETGTGKELFARAVHYGSRRRNQRFVAINTPEISKELLESELFGHTKGSWTGAFNKRDGLFVAANGGTIFLDEITEMPLELQSKLLRVLQEREVRPIGSNKSIPIDVRVVAASNRNLLEYVEAGEFREDLYYRLNILPLAIPPLRERFGDVPVLVQHFLEEIAARKSWPVSKKITPRALAALEHYHWPGNIRQLKNEIERACVVGDDVLTIHDFTTVLKDTKLDLSKELEKPKATADSTEAAKPIPAQLPSSQPEFIAPAYSRFLQPTPAPVDPHKEAQFQEERDQAIKLLIKHDGNVKMLAEELGVHFTTTYRKLESLGIKARDYKRKPTDLIDPYSDDRTSED